MHSTSRWRSSRAGMPTSTSRTTKRSREPLREETSLPCRACNASAALGSRGLAPDAAQSGSPAHAGPAEARDDDEAFVLDVDDHVLVVPDHRVGVPSWPSGARNGWGSPART